MTAETTRNDFMTIIESPRIEELQYRLQLLKNQGVTGNRQHRLWNTGTAAGYASVLRGLRHPALHPAGAGPFHQQRQFSGRAADDERDHAPGTP